VIGCRRSGGALRIDVVDTGPGIAPDRQRDVFTEYYRLDDSAAGGGFGLGLAIVERLARLLDHPLELVSTLGRGCRFSVTVPRARAVGDVARTPDAPADPVRGELVVVIDDEPLVLDGMAGILGA